jgi:HD-GYP domain
MDWLSAQTHRKEMSIPERVLVLADIFEALTAHDRPYKDAKTLTQALTILSRMAKGKSCG